jgi:hypothetical protein
LVDGTGVEKEGGWAMRNAFCMHALKKTEVVDVFRRFRKQIGNGVTTLTVAFEIPQGFHHGSLGHFSEIIKSVAQDIDFLLMIGNEARFEVETIDVTWPALHEDEDHSFSARCEVAWLRDQGVERLGLKRIAAKSCKSNGSKSAGALAEHFSPRKIRC